MRNAVLYALLRVAASLLPFLPLRLVYALARGAGTCAYYLAPGARNGIQSNLVHVLDASPDSAAVRQAAKHAFQFNAMNWVDTLRIGSVPPARILSSVEVEGWDRLAQSLDRGQGLILVGLHLGNIDMVGQVVAAHGVRLTIPVEHMQPERLFRFLMAQRASKGINILPLDEAPRELLRALRRGEMVAVTADRVVAGGTIAVDFFGAPCLLPRGPLALARHSRAPVLVGYGVRTTGEHFKGRVVGPIPMARTEDAQRDMESNARVLVVELERAIRAHADQWLMFAPVWERGGGKKVPATMEQQIEAAR